MVQVCNKLLVGIVCIVLHQSVAAQCVELAFQSPTIVCEGQAISLNNITDANGQSFEWDFCGGDLLKTPTGNTIAQILVAAGPTGISVVKENENYFLFLTGRTSNKLVRIDFGTDPQNPDPAIVDLGNPANALKGPVGLELLKEGDLWYAIAYNSQSDSLVRISFGPSLSNPSPQASSVAKAYGSGNSNSGLEVAATADRVIVAVTSPATNKLTLVNFGNSITNTPSDPSDILTTASVPGASSLRGITLTQQCGQWYGFAVASSSRKIFRLDFGPDLFSQPNVVDITNNFSGTENFQDIQVLQDAGVFVGFILTSQGIIYRAEFGQDITTLPQISNLGNAGVISGSARFDFIKYGSKWSLFTANNGTRFLYRVDFPNQCSALSEADFRFQPEVNSYSTSGMYKITLEAYDPTVGYSYLTKEILVENKSAPQLAFYHSGICADNKTDFIQTSDSDLVNMSWDFDDGNTYTSINPSHIFADGGNYNVRLSATGINGCENSTSKQVTIYDPPEADFTIPSGLLCTNNELTFTTNTQDTFDGHLQYLWYVNNNEVGTQRELKYTFTNTGTSDILLRTSIPGCFDEIAKTTAPVEAGPLIDFSFAGTCEDEPFPFESEFHDPVQSHTWDFGNGETSANLNPEVYFSEPGEYSVSLSGTNAIGCTTVETKAVSVHSKPLIDFTAEGPPNTCSGTATIFENHSTNPDGDDVSEWRWEFGDATPPQVLQTAENGNHVYSASGEYTVSLRATTMSGCVGIAENVVTIYPSPSTAYTRSPICEDKPVLFTRPQDSEIEFIYWEFGTSYYLEESPTHTFPVAGEYPFYLEVMGFNGCISIRTETLHVPVPLTPAFTMVRNCAGEEAVLTDVTTGADLVTSRHWEFENGEALDGSSVSHTFNQTGAETVKLKVTAESGCSYELTEVIEILPSPVAAFVSTPSSGAYPLEVTFTNTSTGSSQAHWIFHDGSGVSTDEPSPTHVFEEPGTFNVELIASNEAGCEDSFNAPVATVDPLPNVDVEMINLTQNADGSARLIVTIHNKGNTVLRQLPVDLNFDGALHLRQIVPEALLPGSKFNFVLNTSIVNINSLQYLCVSLDLPGDLSPDGNQMCKQFESGLLILPAYPNPNQGSLTVEWITQAAKPLQLTVADGLGRKVRQALVEAVPGYNRQVLDLTGLRNGLYFLVIEDGASKNVQRIIRTGAP